jgi:hypothetical protein|tara:strand:- start:2255 stop:3607 length:1353 start_codon:yes stop_codon:yes gene_type:complete
MLGVTYYHQTIRKYVAVFGTLFNDLNIERTNASGTVVEKVKIPLAYGPKQKWLLAMSDTTASRKVTATRSPRMGFALTSVDYDSVRKLNTVGKNWAANSSLSTTTTLLSQFNPVPYNFAFDLFILVKNAEDGTQILEQILPYFTPEFTVTVNTIPDMGIKADIPIVLNSSSVADEYEGDLATRRTITWTLSFTLKGYIYPDIKSSSIIKTIEVNFRIPATAVTTTDLSNYILMESGSASAPVYIQTDGLLIAGGGIMFDGDLVAGGTVLNEDDGGIYLDGLETAGGRIVTDGLAYRGYLYTEDGNQITAENGNLYIGDDYEDVIATSVTILLEDQDGAILTEDFAVGSSDNAGVILLESTVIEIRGGSVQLEDMDGRIITENIQIQTDGTTRIINEREDDGIADATIKTRYTVEPSPSTATANDDYGFSETFEFFQDGRENDPATGDDYT